MASTITLEEAQAHLAELIERLSPGEEVVITQNEQPVARLIGQRPFGRQPGSARGKLTVHTEDDEHLKDFKDYMP
jgi:prevent-host-death family protein